MISVNEAKQLISDHTQPLQALKLSLKKASGHILAADIYARYDIPAFKQSSMDGYALVYQDSSSELEMIGEMAAGTSQLLSINPNQTTRIFTGAPLPEGADTVVMQEKISRQGNKITLQDPKLSPGANVRQIGSEIKAGALAMQKGTALGPAAVGFLAGIGIQDVEVFPMPKVAIILTGKELQQPGMELNFGQVYESNSYSLTAAIKNEGITEIEVTEADDNLEILTDVLRSALQEHDVVLLTGGVSVGDYDFVLEASKKCGIEQIFHKVKQKPGKPLFFGKKDQKLIFGLPGNPSSVLNCYYNYVLPALKAISHKENSVKEISAELTHDCQKPAGLTHFLKGSYKNGKATPLNAQESFRLSSFALANCLIYLPEEQQDFKQGDVVTIMQLPN
ncbi:molybdopterin molybdotransferase MoeA [Pedobacter panaciterrae]|jgi:molybdenum cofactor synthesis domain|uniref:molybdopterin molybdotransferase MoeA n=1 Tax=Pedobacter panaciterrae TaxID=363849 RepID=UPI00155DDA75|nr:gephyrin-like molybdotransferase Glp [Pedobacter panaciterrae]NQX53170.1 molybdopterin molybdotransferase MoeA [Pedobacter panaciterrae]